MTVKIITDVMASGSEYLEINSELKSPKEKLFSPAGIKFHFVVMSIPPNRAETIPVIKTGKNNFSCLFWPEVTVK